MHRATLSCPSRVRMEVGRVAVVDRQDNARKVHQERLGGAAPKPPGFFALLPGFLGSGRDSAHTRRIPAAGSALEVRPRRALSSAQVASAYQTETTGNPART